MNMYNRGGKLNAPPSVYKFFNCGTYDFHNNLHVL